LEERRSETRLVKPENILKRKAGTGGFDECTLVKAQDMIQTNTIEFVPLANDLVFQLGNLLSAIKADPKNATKDQIGEIMYPLMQFKSQGALFHYPVITKMSHILLDLVENLPGFDSNVVDILDAYKKSVAAVLKLNIKNENNKIAKDLCRELGDACDRYRNAKAK
jgi:hypothetical protein